MSERKYISAALHKIGSGGVPMKRKLTGNVRAGPEIKRKAPVFRQIGMKPARVPSDVNTKPVKKTIAQNPEASKKSITGVELQKKAIEKPSVESPSVEPTLDGHYELSPLMSKMLEAELQDVMIKVWQSLPDDAPNEADKLVAEKYRNKAGDALRNVIGLNITERLLNIHNTLHVKISFTGKPARADLINFLKKYHITSFKRVGAGTFAARMQNFQDFDDICTEKDLKCGGRIRVTVTPCVQFLACPPNLRTCYDGKSDVTNKNIDKSSGKNKPAQISVQEEKSADVTAKSVTESVKSVEKKANSVVQKPAPTKQNITPKVTPTKTNQSAASIEVASKEPSQANQTESPLAAPKTTAVKSNAPVSEDKEVPAKTNSAKPNEVIQKENTTTKVTPTKPNAAATEKQNAVVKVTPIAAKNQNATIAKANPSDADNEKPANKVTPAKPVAANNAATAKQIPVTPSQSQSAAEKTIATKPADNQNAAFRATPAKLNQNAVAKATQAKPAVALNQNVAKATPAKPATALNQNADKATQAKPAVALNQNVAKATPAKPATALNQNAAIATQAKPAVALNQNVAKATPAKPATALNQNAAKATQAKPAVALNQNVAKAMPAKPATALNQNAAKATPAKPAVAKQAAKAVAQTNQTATAKKVTPKVIAKAKGVKLIKSPTKPVLARKKVESDFDELDDHDILAMITEGIVLDECGSEED